MLSTAIHVARLLLRRPGFFGNYSTFAEASELSRGYDTTEIGTAAAKRAQSLLAENEPTITNRAQQVLAALACIRRPQLSVLDVGGAGGVYYLMLRKWLPPCSWTVLETPSVCYAMRSTGIPVKFVTELQEGRFDVVLLSGVIQYLKDPHAELAKYCGLGDYVLLNRLPLIDGCDRVTIQRVGANTSYPAWFLGRHNFEREVQKRGSVVMRWAVPEDRPYLDGRRVAFRGMLLRSTQACTSPSQN